MMTYPRGVERTSSRTPLYLVSVVLLLLALVASSAAAQGVYGGTLRVALRSNPNTLDLHTTTAGETKIISQHIFETLFSIDENHQPRPHLIESFSANADNTEYVFHLRRGVRFHNGEELTAEDVVASLRRWAQHSSAGKTLIEESVSELSIENELTFRMVLRNPNGVLALQLSDAGSQNAVIMPAMIAQANWDTSIRDVGNLVGTGPFRIVDFNPDIRVRLERFDDYTPLDADPSGFSGRRTAYVDAIEFVPTPDAMARLNTVEVGEMHFAEMLPPDEFARVSRSPNLRVIVRPVSGYGALVLNLQQGPLAESQTLRQAILAALNKEDIGRAAYGPTDLWDLNPSVFVRGMALWTDAGSEFYNQASPERARELMGSAGYDGETLRIVGNTDNPMLYNTALVVEAQLREAGFDVQLDAYDNATAQALRPQFASWDIYPVSMAARSEPTIMPHFWPDWLGTWPSTDMQRILEDLRAISDFDVRFALVEELQELVFEDVPFIKTVTSAGFDVIAPTVQNHQTVDAHHFFWNLWLEAE